jgi:hypothetical protein
MKRTLLAIAVAAAVLLAPAGAQAGSPGPRIRCHRNETTCWRHERRPSPVRRRCWNQRRAVCRSTPVQLVPLQ